MKLGRLASTTLEHQLMCIVGWLGFELIDVLLGAVQVV